MEEEFGMKRVRFMGIGLLMCSLLLTSCGQDAGIPNNSGVWKFGVKSWGEKFGDK